MYLIKRFNVFAALFVGILLLAVSLLISTMPFSFFHGYRFIFAISFPGHFFEFFSGMMLALFVLKKDTKTTQHKKTFTVSGSIGILFLIGILVVINNMNDPNRPVSFF